MNSDNLTLLRVRVAELEAAEAADAALKKKENAMDRLQAILAEKKLSVQYRINRSPKDHVGWLAHHINRGEVDIIDTLIDIIDGLHTRICNLEGAQKPADPGHLSAISDAVAAEIAAGIAQGNALRA